MPTAYSIDNYLARGTADPTTAPTLAADTQVGLYEQTTSGHLWVWNPATSAWVDVGPGSGGGGGGGGLAATVLLNYIASTDLTNVTLPENTWTDTFPDQSFTVPADATVVVFVGGCIHANTGTDDNVVSRLNIDDGTTLTGTLGGEATAYNNFMSGIPPVVLTGLSAGAHTIKHQLLCHDAATNFYCRAAGHPEYENFSIVILALVAPTPPALATHQVFLADDYAIPTNQAWHNILTLAVEAGTWLISANTIFNGDSSTAQCSIRVWDNSSTYYGAASNVAQYNAGVAIPGVVAVLASPTTLYLDIWCYVNSWSITKDMANTTAGGKGTWLTAVQVA